MHFCAEEAMALVALIGTAVHFWRCQCSNIQQRFWRVWCRLFSHHDSPVLRFDGSLLCRRCNRYLGRAP